ncbi:MAG: division/cell wall cluster transcriptional repressor MraZ [Halioglobus sp.]|nr:division/cell wall cluster transcriptional repressor MraZ [Halioglobus sp.]
MFRGVQHINLDAKGRLAIPARQREPLLSQCAGQLVVTIDVQTKCLVIYPLPEWERVAQDIESLPSLKYAVRRFQRLVLGYATDVELDGSGRMLLPPSHREYARLEKKVVLVGQGKKLELWAEDRWLAECEQALEDSGPEAELPEELQSLRF